jgi:holliday junction DNA helicase RuvB
VSPRREVIGSPTPTDLEPPGDFETRGDLDFPDCDESLTPEGSPHRSVDPAADPAEMADEARLRPRRLADFVGQAELTEHLEIVIEAARKRGQAVDHLLFVGPPGLGKTSLSGIVAAEMGVGLRITSGPALVRTGDLAALLTDLQPGDVLFIDEVHRLPRAVEEVLYPAMEDFQLDLLVGKGPTARSIRLDLPRFTLVGATTRTGLLTSPLRDRFGFVARLDLYGADDLQAIVERSAGILGVPIDRPGARAIAERSRGTPRIANRLLRRVRDFVEVRADGSVTRELATEGLDLFGVDRLGLDKVDRAVLETLCRRFAGRPVGLTTLAQCVGEETDTIEDAYEPFLVQQGLVLRTPRGRMATQRAFAHLGVNIPGTLHLSPEDPGGVTAIL